jgi:hypothetical protein
MQTEVEQLRDLARAFWAGQPLPCPKHAGVNLKGEFVQTTDFDHVVLTCPRGRETITIPQRPKQVEFNAHQVEGFVENLQRGDKTQCYRCQSALEMTAPENSTTGVTDYTFTCVRCFSYGSWVGRPDEAKIGGAIA